MILTNQKVIPLYLPNKEQVYKLLQIAGRTCHKSESKITDSSSQQFLNSIVNVKHHLSVIQHMSATFKIITNRAIANQIVRHRLAAYSQESTRYVGYNDDLVFIAPVDYSHHIKEKDIKYSQEDIDKIEDEYFKAFLQSLYNIEKEYFKYKEINKKRDVNRDLLPLALKTQIVITLNFRMWKHVIQQRTTKFAHPMIKILFEAIENILKKEYGIIFKNEQEVI